MQWSPASGHDGTTAGQDAAQAGPLSPSSYSNLQITVEYHTPQPEPFSPLGAGADYQSVVTSSDMTGVDTESTGASTVINGGRVGYGNDPLFVCHDPGTSNGWDQTASGGAEDSWANGNDSWATGNDSWAMGMGMDLSRLSLTDYSGDTSLMTNLTTHVDRVEQARKREEFKHTVLSSVGLAKEPTEEDKIRQDFKKQILSNLDKKDLSTTASNTSSAKAREDIIKDQFKSQIINNLNR